MKTEGMGMRPHQPENNQRPVGKTQKESPVHRGATPEDALLWSLFPELFCAKYLPLTLLSRDALCGSHQAGDQSRRLETLALSGLIS